MFFLHAQSSLGGRFCGLLLVGIGLDQVGIGFDIDDEDFGVAAPLGGNSVIDINDLTDLIDTVLGV